MGKLKRENAITLVALVITIIILLILAGITISQLTGSGLFENAKLAEDRSKNAQEKENGILSDYEQQIGKYLDTTRDSNMVSYSNTEKVIGTWMNGETLYQKSYSLTNVGDGYVIDQSLNVNNIIMRNIFGNCNNYTTDRY